MRKKYNEVVERGRLRDGQFATKTGDGFGFFFLRCPKTGERLKIMVGPAERWTEEGMEGEAWDHVSVSCERRCPWWDEMCWVKEQFFEDDETVIQYHPAKADYVNLNPYVLHIWRPKDSKIPMPPVKCV
jgi:hypothetical protein